MSKTTRIRVGIGGWTYEPWRGHFFPKGLPQKQELSYASRHTTAIEVNGTYYRSQKPATFAKWRDETPDDFVFSLKAPRYATNRRVLAEASESIERFIDSGITELGTKLGPLLWQFPPTKHFEPDDMEAFMGLLPKWAGGAALRHVLDVRHASFMTPAYVDLARRHGISTVFTDSSEYPSFADVTGDFVYARLMGAKPDVKTGYTAPALKRWAEHARAWAEGEDPADLPHADALGGGRQAPRDVFVYFINGAKENAPAAAMALLKRLSENP